jgi:hypothetical protein
VDTFADIGLFVLFLLEYGAYLFASWRVISYVQVDPARMLSPLLGQLVVLIAIVHIGLSLLLLARVFSPLLLGLILAAYELGLLVGFLIRVILGTSVTSSWLFGFELTVRHPIAMLGGQSIVGLVTVLGYPAAAGVAYFSLTKGSEKLLFWVIALTAAVALVGVVTQLILSAAAVLNPYLDDDTRTQLLITQLMSIPQPALWLTIAYWASHAGHAGIGHHDEQRFILALVALVVLIVSFTVVPFLVGALQARRIRSALLGREKRAWGRLAETAEIPMRDEYESDLRLLAQDVEREHDAFVDEHKAFFDVLDTLQNTEARAELARSGLGVPKGFDADVDELSTSEPRLRFARALQRVESATEELIDEVEQSKPPPAQLAAAWAKAARGHRSEAEAAAAAERKTPVRGRAALSFVVTPVLGVVLDQFGALIWNELSSLKP